MFSPNSSSNETGNFFSSTSSRELPCSRTRHSGSPILIARTNKQVADISRAVRAQLKHEDAIRGTETTIEAVTPSGQPARLEIAAGDQIRFQLRNDRLAVVTGSVATVTAVHGATSPQGNTPDNPRIEAVIDNRPSSFSAADIADDRGRAASVGPMPAPFTVRKA